MIYLRGRGLLFLKPYKTAGTSLEIALSRHAGPEDIVTPVILGDELLREELGGQFPVNWADPETEAAYRAAVERHRHDMDLDRRLFDPKRARFYHHIKPKAVAARAGEDFLLGADVVTMCRHPYEVLVSQIHYFRSFNKRPESFAELAEKLTGNLPLNIGFYSYKGRDLPAFVLRYEQLTDDLAELERRTGLDLVAGFPRTKQVQRTDRRPAGEVLTARQKQICYRDNAAIFERFGYET